MLQFFISLVAVALLLLGSLYFTVEQQWISSLPSFALPTVLLLVFVTGIIFKYLYRIKQPGTFVQLFLLLMVVKMIAFFAYLIAIAVIDEQQMTENVIFFLVAYFTFTTLEIGFLYRHINRNG